MIKAFLTPFLFAALPVVEIQIFYSEVHSSLAVSDKNAVDIGTKRVIRYT